MLKNVADIAKDVLYTFFLDMPTQVFRSIKDIGDWPDGTILAILGIVLHALAAAFDHFSGQSYALGDAQVRFFHAPLTELDGETVKDWKRILNLLLA